MLADSGRAELEQLLRSWLLELRAEHKSEKTRLAYGDAANQFIAFLTNPPSGLDGELAAAIAEAPAVAEILDLKAVHIRLFMSYLYAAGRKPSTVNNRYRGLQQWFRWLVDEGEIEYAPSPTSSPRRYPRRRYPWSPATTSRRSCAPARSAASSTCATRQSSGSSAIPG